MLCRGGCIGWLPTLCGGGWIGWLCSGGWAPVGWAELVSPTSVEYAWGDTRLNTFSMPGPNMPIIICLNMLKKSVWCLPITTFVVSQKAFKASYFSWKDVVSGSPGNRTLGISDLRYETPLLFLLNDIKHFIWNWSMASFSCAYCSGDKSSMVTSITSPISGILTQLEGPTERAKKYVDAKSAPRAKHTASRTSWLNTRADSKVCQSIFLKLTKGNAVKYQSLELARWY
jgi:hypothetical protein